jgi:hypothetical protein
LQFVATRLLETELRVQTADNDINALKNNGSIPEGYTINHYLTDTDAWFLTTDVPNGMKHFIRTPLQNSMDGDFDTGNVDTKPVSVIVLVFLTLWACLAQQARRNERGLVPPFFLVYFAV